MTAGNLVALTIWQPWAWAIAAGHKRVENRTWVPARQQLKPGDYLAIHAGKQSDLPAIAAIEEEMGLKVPEHLDYGAVLAVARYRGFLRVDVPRCGNSGQARTIDTDSCSLPPAERLGFDDGWLTGPIGFILTPVVRLLEPVPVRGGQKLWNLPPDAYAAVRHQYARALSAPPTPERPRGPDAT